MSSGPSDARFACDGPLEEKVEFRLSESLLEPFQRAVDDGEFPNLSEALRAGLRAGRPEIEDAEPPSIQPTNPGGVVRDE